MIGNSWTRSTALICSALDWVGVGEARGVGVGWTSGLEDAEAEDEGDGTMLAEGVDIGRSIVSGIGTGVADGVASGSCSGGIVSAEFVLEKIVSRFRRGSSGLGAGVLAESVASMGGDSWALALGGAGNIDIQGYTND